MFLLYRNHYSYQDTVIWVCVYVRAQLLDCFQLLAAPWTVACQVPLSMEFSMQEYWSGLPFPSPGDLPDPEIKLTFLEFPELAGRFFTTVAPGKPQETITRPSISLVLKLRNPCVKYTVTFLNIWFC